MTHDVLLLAIGSEGESSTITNELPEADRFATILWKHDRRVQRRMTESTSAILRVVVSGQITSTVLANIFKYFS